jgi:small-conductance mechanosensitive channel
MQCFGYRAGQIVLVSALLAMTSISADAQLDKLRKKLPGLGGSSEVETIVRQIDGVRAKSAYARISLSLADDIIRRQALRNTARKSSEGQIQKDEQEIAALDKSIAAKKKLLVQVGQQANSGTYDEKTSAEVDKQMKAEEQKRAEQRAMVDEEIADKEKREKELSPKDKENYGKLARLLWGASKQEKEAVEGAHDLKPRAESAAANTKNSPYSLASTQPKRLKDGVDGLSEVLSEGPQHAATLASVANHLAKIGGIDLTDPNYQPKVVTSDDEIPTDW